MDDFINPEVSPFVDETSGFTLIEILTVIAIIGILVTIAVYSLGFARSQARIKSAIAEATSISKAIELLVNDTGEWPNHQVPYAVCVDLPGGCPVGNEVEDLLSPEAGLTQTDGNYSNWNGPYIGTIENDPWGNSYFFDSDYDIDNPNGVWRVVVGSFGPNGVGSNLYDSDDIVRIIYP